MGQTGAWGSTTREVEGVPLKSGVYSSCNNEYFEIPPPHSSGSEYHWLRWSLPSVQDMFIGDPLYYQGVPYK